MAAAASRGGAGGRAAGLGWAGRGGRPAAARGSGWKLHCGPTAWGESQCRPERAEFCLANNDGELEKRVSDFGAASFTSSSRYFI